MKKNLIISFPPVSEAETGAFFAEEKAILFMRSIRERMEFLKKSFDQLNSSADVNPSAPPHHPNWTKL
jgi:hypothetical protein